MTDKQNQASPIREVVAYLSPTGEYVSLRQFTNYIPLYRCDAPAQPGTVESLREKYLALDGKCDAMDEELRQRLGMPAPIEDVRGTSRDEQNQFETAFQWMVEAHGGNPVFNKYEKFQTREHGGLYRNTFTEARWEGWSARAKLEAGRASLQKVAIPDEWRESLGLTIERLNNDADLHDSMGNNSAAEDRRARAYEIGQILAASPQGAALPSEREAFEAWALKSGWSAQLVADRAESTTRFRRKGCYRHNGLQDAWEVWQARAALQGQQSSPAPLPALYWKGQEITSQAVLTSVMVSEADAAFNAGRASPAPASDRVAVLEAVIRAVRQYPDFDEPSVFSKMMDDALSGKTPELLRTIDSLSRGEMPAPAGDIGERSAAIPEGWKLVPIEPTIAMMDAAMWAHDNKPAGDWGRNVPASDDEIYRAMLDASPTAPQQPTEKP
jgi:hypothetical protein